MVWKSEYAVARRLKSASDPEYRARRNRQSTNDRERRKAYMRSYYKAHPEKFKRKPENSAKHYEKRRIQYANSADIRRVACANAKKWRMDNPEKHRASRLRKYGITIDQFEKSMTEQGGACAICRHSEKKKIIFPIVDHCHKTGEFRGILCANCNHGLGKFKDSVDLLRAAILYIEQHRSKSKCQSSTKK